jgi:hypothetical protein
MRFVLVLVLVLVLAPRTRADDHAADEAVRKALADHKIKVRFDAAPVDEVLDFVRDLAGVNVAVVASATDDLRLTLKGSDVSARSMLEAIAASDDGFVYEVWHGFVFVSSKARPRKVPPAADMSDEAKKTCDTTRITATFSEVTVTDFLDYLNEKTGLSFSAAQGVAGKTLDLRVKDVPASAVLDVVCRLLELKVQRAGDVNVLKAR